MSARGGEGGMQAILEACRERFRPILMTTLAALFGAIPLALATGPGAELRSPLGITIIGGMLLSQVLTLYTTPVVYLALERLATAATGAAAQAGGQRRGGTWRRDRASGRIALVRMGG